jgi:hypothetical protein
LTGCGPLPASGSRTACAARPAAGSRTRSHRTCSPIAPVLQAPGPGPTITRGPDAVRLLDPPSGILPVRPADRRAGCRRGSNRGNYLAHHAGGLPGRPPLRSARPVVDRARDTRCVARGQPDPSGRQYGSAALPCGARRPMGGRLLPTCRRCETEPLVRYANRMATLGLAAVGAAVRTNIR